MPKINQEEYEILKDLDDKWKWIARDRDTGKLPYSDMVHVYEEKPFKTDNVWTVGYGAGKLEKNLFQFIQWEDEEPYNIAELIEEYEGEEEKYEMLLSDFLVRLEESGIDTSRIVIEESEETEVKTLESIREEIWEEMLRLEDKRKDQWVDIKYQTLREVLQKLGHLDEPEVLSDKWIDGSVLTGYPYEEYQVVPAEVLQNLLVPKQEKVTIPQFVADCIESAGSNRESNKEYVIRSIIDQYYEGNFDPIVFDWFGEKGNLLKFYRAVDNGYTVEEKQKYYVLNNEKYFLLGKDKGHGFIFSTGGNSKLGSMERTSATFELTEQEIKDYDPRYWAFRKPVEELEE